MELYVIDGTNQVVRAASMTVGILRYGDMGGVTFHAGVWRWGRLCAGGTGKALGTVCGMHGSAELVRGLGFLVI